MDKADELVAALVGEVNSPSRSPALWSLPPVKYPLRQIQVTEPEEGTYEVRYYHRYKDRRPRAKRFPIKEVSIRDALNAALIPSGFTVTAVVDCDAYIIIYVHQGGIFDEKIF